MTDNALQQITELNNSKVIEQILVNETEDAPAMTEQIKGLLTEKTGEQMSEIKKLYWMIGKVSRTAQWFKHVTDNVLEQVTEQSTKWLTT